MKLRYQFWLYPSAPQRTMLAEAFGCARIVFNDALRARQDAYRQGAMRPTAAELSKRFVTDAKKTDERHWLDDASAVVLQQSLRDLETAYSNFFASGNGTRKGPRTGPPKFKKKTSRQSIRFTANARFSITEGGALRLPKIGDVKIRWSRRLPSAPSSVTVVKDTSGRYFASFVVEAEDKPLPELDLDETETGIDLGLSTYAVLRGRKVSSPKFFRRHGRAGRGTRLRRRPGAGRRGVPRGADRQVRPAAALLPPGQRGRAHLDRP
ncbi:RNA-guided endonuclease TnpB family protein [Streptomyces sp. C]|uniref:RNA-guided endonuclease InsQ/TnpB family protein n=1 Tax=Streptomyces sp. C TaxID=253839 RepID=UPI0001DEF5CF|nr:transposase [Streptomyces sp. C]